MENNDTNTDYHKFVRVGEQKWEIVEITIGIIFFFCLRYVFTIFYRGSFQIPSDKNYPYPKCQFSPKIPIWPKSLYINVLTNGSAPPSPREGGWGWGWVVRTKNIVSTCWWEESCLRKNSVVIASHIFQNNYFKYLLPGVALSTSPLEFFLVNTIRMLVATFISMF